jgi:hypothetical protein
MPNHKTDINNNGAFSTDMIGANYEYPESDWQRREQIISDHIDYTKGLLYFFGNDPRVPPEMREEISTWGYPADEYREYGELVTPALYPGSKEDDRSLCDDGTSLYRRQHSL